MPEDPSQGFPSFGVHLSRAAPYFTVGTRGTLLCGSGVSFANMHPTKLLAHAGLHNDRFEGRVDYNLIPHLAKQSNNSSPQLLVFVNGLMLPQDGWYPVMAEVIQSCKALDLPRPAILSYDRAGQGKSGAHPKDSNPEPKSEPGHRHNCTDAAVELGELLNHVVQPPTFPGPAGTKVVLVCNSIGCPIARLYAQQHVESIAGLIFLGSNITNTDFVSLWPDPDAPEFDASSLPDDIDADGLRLTRLKFRKVFHPSVPNPEGLSRRNLPELLAYGDEAQLYGDNIKGPFLTVVGHDQMAFAEQSRTVSFPI